MWIMTINTFFFFRVMFFNIDLRDIIRFSDRINTVASATKFSAAIFHQKFNYLIVISMLCIGAMTNFA